MGTISCTAPCLFYSQRAKRLAAIQAIHELDNELRRARKGGEKLKPPVLDARAQITARRNDRNTEVI